MQEHLEGMPPGQAVSNRDGRFVYDRLGSGENPARWDVIGSCGSPMGPLATVSDVMAGGENRTYSYLSLHLSEHAPQLAAQLGSIAQGSSSKVHLWAGSPGATATPHFDYEGAPCG